MVICAVHDDKSCEKVKIHYKNHALPKRTNLEMKQVKGIGGGGVFFYQLLI